MKYFLEWDDRLPHQPPDGMKAGIPYEITASYAEEQYIDAAGKGMTNLVAKPNFAKGAHIKRRWYRIWGTDYTGKELFKLRLEGVIAKEVLGK